MTYSFLDSTDLEPEDLETRRGKDRSRQPCMDHFPHHTRKQHKRDTGGQSRRGWGKEVGDDKKNQCWN